MSFVALLGLRTLDFLSLTAVFEPVEDGWVQARIVELPVVITAGRTQAEATEMLWDALRELLLAEADVPSGATSVPAGAVTQQFKLSVA